MTPGLERAQEELAKVMQLLGDETPATAYTEAGYRIWLRATVTKIVEAYIGDTE